MNNRQAELHGIASHRRSRKSGDSWSRTLARNAPMVSPLRTTVCRRWPVPSQYEYVTFSGSFFSSCAHTQQVILTTNKVIKQQFLNVKALDCAPQGSNLRKHSHLH